MVRTTAPAELPTSENQIKKYWEVTNPDNNPRRFMVFPQEKGEPPLCNQEVNSAEEVIKLCRKYNGKGICCLSVNAMKDGADADHLTSIDNIFIDVDVDKRIKGLSTEEDKKTALSVTKRIIEGELYEINLQPSLYLDSGNGFQITIPLSIPLLEDSEKKTEKIRAVQERLSELYSRLKKFDIEGVVHVDVAVITDVARKGKIPGTLNVKKEMEPPYREARIIEIFDSVSFKILAEANTAVFNELKPVKTQRTPQIPPAARQVKGDRPKPLRPCMQWSHDAGDKWKGDQGNFFRKAISMDMFNSQWTIEEGLNFFEIHDKLSGETYSKNITEDQLEQTRKKEYQKVNCDKLQEKCSRIVNRYCPKCPWNKTIPVMNAGSKIATLHIPGINAFEIKNGDTSILPMTQAKTTTWYASTHYRREITKALTASFNVRKEDAERITNEVCSKVPGKIKELKDAGAFAPKADEDEQSIIDSISKVVCTRSEDGNIYNIYLNEEIIKLKDTDIYSGPTPFCVQYLNRFLKMIVISEETWGEIFVPYLLSEEILEVEEDRIETKADVVTEIFLQYLGNIKVYDWKNMEKRTSHKNSIYYDKEKGQIRISSPFIQWFFERKNIEKKYGISTISFASHLRGNDFLVRKRVNAKIKKGSEKTETFWLFRPEKLEISDDDIAEEKEQEEKKIEEFGGEGVQ